jgi:hypothetical protein
MSYRRNLSRLGVASLLVAAVSAPAASAMPADPQTTVDTASAPVYVMPPSKSDAAQLDMHASTVHKPKPATADLRSENAKDPIAPETPKPVGVNARRPLPGPPVYSTSTDVIALPKQQPVATTGGDGGDIEWPIAAISIAGALLIGGGIGAVGYRHRATARPAV